jgi:hypothetical protein
MKTNIDRNGVYSQVARASAQRYCRIIQIISGVNQFLQKGLA